MYTYTYHGHLAARNPAQLNMERPEVQSLDTYTQTFYVYNPMFCCPCLYSQRTMAKYGIFHASATLLDLSLLHHIAATLQNCEIHQTHVESHSQPQRVGWIATKEPLTSLRDLVWELNPMINHKKPTISGMASYRFIILSTSLLFLISPPQ